MMQKKTIFKYLKLIGKWLIGIVLFYVLWFEVLDENNITSLKKSLLLISTSELIELNILLVLLMLVNWGIESYKWQLLIQKIYSISFKQAFKAVWVGNSMGIFTPNRVGEIVGRLQLQEKGNKIRGGLLTTAGSIGMSTAGLILTLCGLHVLPKDYIFEGAFYLQFVFVLVGLTLYLTLPKWTNWLMKTGLFKRFLDYRSTAKLLSIPDLIIQVVLSFIRYLTFLIQYILVFYYFDSSIDVVSVAGVMSIIYFIQSFVPTPVVVELGIRGNLAVLLLTPFMGENAGLIAVTAYAIWVLNMFIPSAVGYIWLLRK